MEIFVKVIGWERVIQQNGKIGVRIYGVCDLVMEFGVGQEVVWIYINLEYCNYELEIGYQIIVVEGCYGVDCIIWVV